MINFLNIFIRTEQFDSRALILKEKIITNFQSLIAWYLSICDDKKYDILYMFSEVI